MSALALTMGEPAGIGGEITLKAWLGRREQEVPAFFALDDVERLRRLAERLGWQVPIEAIAEPEAAAGMFADALPVLSRPLPGGMTPGQPDPANAEAVLHSIRDAVRLTLAGRAVATVTNPIHKKVLADAGFKHGGHTEYLAELSGARRAPVMMLCCPGLRVVPVTVHAALRQALDRLSVDLIVETAQTTADALQRDFGLPTPHLVVAGLNPHAGEGGLMGREEIDVITPAIEILKRAGISVHGPAPADTLFHERARKGYDAALCMYHDQALIPLKTIGFYEGVNVTLGLPIVRSSPDHGTALEIAGTGVADERSLVAALKVAAAMASRRQAYDERAGAAVG